MARGSAVPDTVAEVVGAVPATELSRPSMTPRAKSAKSGGNYKQHMGTTDVTIMPILSLNRTRLTIVAFISGGAWFATDDEGAAQRGDHRQAERKSDDSLGLLIREQSPGIVYPGRVPAATAEHRRHHTDTPAGTQWNQCHRRTQTEKTPCSPPRCISFTSYAITPASTDVRDPLLSARLVVTDCWSTHAP